MVGFTFILNSGQKMTSSNTNSMNRTTQDISEPTNTTQPIQPLPAQFAERYTVQSPIGEGGFGTVMLAYDEKLERSVAIKIPRRDRFRNAQELEAFTKEAKTIARLQHDGIVSVYDVGVHESTPFIVLEFIRGRSLDNWLKYESTSWTTSARLVKDIALALAHAHDQGFVHRDIKPSNILLDNEDKPHVTDFGLAVRQSDLNSTGEDFAGTVQYMAPEQVRGESHRIRC
jgi:serine/threonine protein kinase